ncbi:hypothetical protein KI387_021263, partial [Taxus chinensis]
MEFSRMMETISGRGIDASTVAIAFISILLLFYIFRKIKSSRMPPGPFAWPIIGNLHQLGKLPYRSLQDLAQKHGPVMCLRLGYFPTLVVSSAEMAKEFLKTHDLAFASRPESAAGRYMAYNQELLSAKRLESFRSIREEEVYEAMRGIWEKSRQGSVAINMSTFAQSLISAIIWRILVGTKYSGDDVAGNDQGKEFSNMVEEVSSTVTAVNLGDYIPYIDWLDLQGIKKRMRKANGFFDRVVQKIIEEHDNVKSRQASNVKDIIDVLLELSGNDTLNIKAIIFDMFLGGIGTIGTALEWTMSEMVKNPRVAKKLQEEIESVVGKDRIVTESDLGSMEYLKCVVKESLRLYPPAPLLFPHESTQDCIVGGFFIPQKTRLMVNVWAIGRDPAVWDDPLTFKPERFIGKDIDIFGRDFNILPFGAGRRGCP